MVRFGLVQALYLFDYWFILVLLCTSVVYPVPVPEKWLYFVAQDVNLFLLTSTRYWECLELGGVICKHSRGRGGVKGVLASVSAE